jgi:glycosyltransferase involved in cell wall biosynthesis
MNAVPPSVGWPYGRHETASPRFHRPEKKAATTCLRWWFGVASQLLGQVLLRTDMRVLHVHSGNLYGGIETLLLNLVRCRHFCLDMQPHFALCFEGQIAEELRSAGVRVCTLGVVRTRLPWTIWQARMRLRDLLGRECFDVVVCHSAWSQAIFGPVVRSAGLPLVFWLHNAIGKLTWLDRWSRLTQPDLVVCNSQFTKKTLPLLYPEVESRVLYCPMPRFVHQDNKAERRLTRQSLNTSEEAIVILQVGRLESWKGQALLLSALGVLREVPNWVCWQVGGPQRAPEAHILEKLKSSSKRLGVADRVLFLGQRRDVPRIMAAADVYCQPNTGPEPFGIALVESLLAGLPVVTSATGGALEIVDESCGVFIQPHDVAGLASVLRRLMENRNLRSLLGAAGQSRVEKLCDPAGQMDGLYGALNSAVKAGQLR